MGKPQCIPKPTRCCSCVYCSRSRSVDAERYTDAIVSAKCCKKRKRPKPKCCKKCCSKRKTKYLWRCRKKTGAFKRCRRCDRRYKIRKPRS